METKYKILLGVGLLVGAFAFGRYTVPERTITVVETVEVEKRVVDRDTDTVIVEVRHPDGTVEIRTEIRDKTHSEESKLIASKNSTETVKLGSRLNISALAGLPLSGPLKPIYGAHISRELLGPITIGAWGLSNKTLGVSIGLNF